MSPQDLAAKAGETIGSSEWFEVSQERINQFAEATPDLVDAIVEGAGAFAAGAVAAAAARYAAPEKVSLVVVGNAAQFLDKLKTLRSDVTVIKAADLDLSSPTLGAK